MTIRLSKRGGFPDVVILGTDETENEAQAQCLQDKYKYQIIQGEELIEKLIQGEADLPQIIKFNNNDEDEAISPEFAKYFKATLCEIIDPQNPVVYVNFPQNKKQKKQFEEVLKESPGGREYAIINIDVASDEKTTETFAEEIANRENKRKWDILENIKNYRTRIKEVCDMWSDEGKKITQFPPLKATEGREGLTEYLIGTVA